MRQLQTLELECMVYKKDGANFNAGDGMLKAVISETIHSFVLCNAFCNLVIPYAILQSRLVCEDRSDIFADRAHGIYANSL